MYSAKVRRGRSFPTELFPSRYTACMDDLFTLINIVARKLLGLFVPLFQKALLRNRTYFYDQYQGSDNPILQVFYNLQLPKRVLKKFFYGQIVRLPNFVCLADPCPQILDTDEVRQTARRLKKDGVVVLEGKYLELADYLLKKYDVDPEALKTQALYKSIFLSPDDNKTIELMTDEFILSVFALYYGYQPYVRMIPDIRMTNISESSRKEEEEKGLPNQWHFDEVNMIQAAVLLNDVTENDTHMVICRGGHRTHRVAVSASSGSYSDAYIRKYYEIVHCCGPKGTLYLFDSNSPHAMYDVNNSLRLTVKTMYTPGNDIMPLRHPEREDYRLHPDGIDLSRLPLLQRQSLRLLMMR